MRPSRGSWQQSHAPRWRATSSGVVAQVPAVCACACALAWRVSFASGARVSYFHSFPLQPTAAEMARTKASAKKSAGGKSPKAKASKKTTKTARKAGKGGKRKFKPGTVALREIRKIQKGRGGHILTPLRSSTLH